MSQSDDRWAITDTLCRYARCIDLFDFEGVRSVFSDDAVIEYGGYPVFHGGAEAAAFLQKHTASTEWHQHMVSVVDMRSHISSRTQCRRMMPIRCAPMSASTGTGCSEPLTVGRSSNATNKPAGKKPEGAHHEPSVPLCVAGV
jgi:SnoaL-like domain